MSSKRKWIVVDLDGTITDITHRKHLAQQGLWDEFNEAAFEDPPNSIVTKVINILEDWYDVMVVTGRPTKYQVRTVDWLHAHLFAPEVLLMRASDDYRSDHEVKIAALERFFGNKEAVLNAVAFVLEDRDKVVEQLRNYGLTVWQIRQGDY